MAESFADDAQFVTVNGVWLKSRSDFQDLMQRLHGPDGPFHASERETMEDQIRFLAPDVAMVHSKFRVSGDVIEDGTAVTRDGIGIRVLRKQNGCWETVGVQNADVTDRRT